MEYKYIIKLRLPEIQLLAIVPTQLKFSIVQDHDELYIFIEIFIQHTVLVNIEIFIQTKI
jgi:hypothetical protein